MRNLLVVDGVKAIKSYQKEFRKVAREYREVYRGWGLTYKKVKPKTAKKPYYYWYKWEYDPDKQNNVWTYLGKEKPELDIPDPPISRLDEIEYQVVGENVMITDEELEKVTDLFEGYVKFEVSPA